MEKEQVPNIINAQKEFFNTGKTKEVNFRLTNLKKLKQLVLTYQNRLNEALWADLHKPKFEAYAGEVGFVLQEINIQIRGIRKWSKPKRVRSPLLHFISSSFIYPEPYGRVLIFSPWNFPFQLAFTPLVGAMSAGNCIVLKPSQHTPNTSSVMEDIIGQNFNSDYIAFFRGGRDINHALLEEKYDYIFFTGSSRVGKTIMETASRNLTPVSLELGGKNPCIVHADAPIKMAAKRFTWGKFFNAGQSCIAPDYLLIHKEIKDQFLDQVIQNIQRFYGDDPKLSNDFLRIVNRSNTERLQEMMASGRILTGGNVSLEENYIAPTIIDNVLPDDPIMQNEVFGPVLPVLSYSNIDEAIDIITRKPKPLTFYLFTTNRALQKRLLKQISFGCASLNETVKHYINPNLPFGGVGESGMGRYHGKKSFETFTNYKSVLRKTTLFDFPIRYPPYTNRKLSLIKRLIR